VGITVWDKAKVQIEYCDIEGNKTAGMALSQEANGSIWSSKIYDGLGDGISVSGGSPGSKPIMLHMMQCYVTNNASTGVRIEGATFLSINRCGINENKDYGVLVRRSGSVIIGKSFVTNNGRGNVSSDPNASSQISESVTTNS